MPKEKSSLVPAGIIEKKILLIRGQKVMLDVDLAELYGVPTKVLNQAVSRNRDRFPEDFMFKFASDDLKILRFQFGTSRLRTQFTPSNLRSQTVTSRWGGRRHLPYAFTEQGVAMLSCVLNSPRAVQVNIEIMRTFVRLRRILATHADLTRKLNELERKYDGQFAVVFEAIRQLMTPPISRRRRIGFTAREKSAKYSVKRKR